MVSKTNSGGWKNENGNIQHLVSSLFVLSFLAFMLLSVSLVYAPGPEFPLVCDSLGTPNTVYDMTQNLSTAGDTCLTITANNVTLDCKGFTINYSTSATGYGINITGHNFTTVKNCIIVQTNLVLASSHAIYLDSSNNGTFINNTMTTGDGCGFEMISSSFNNVSLNAITVTIAEQGIVLDGNSTYNTFSSNNITCNGTCTWGVLFSPDFGAGSADNNILSSNSINSTGTTSVEIQSNNNTIFNNTITSTGTDINALVISNGASNNTIFGNHITALGATNVTGIRTTNSAYNNTIYNNFLNGTASVATHISGPNFWNTTLNCSGAANIINGPCIGGNFYAKINGNGFSQNTTACVGNSTGFCTSPNGFDSNNTDLLPLTSVPNVTLNSPANATNSSNTTINFNWTATDNFATSLNCTLYINGATSSNYTNASTLNGTTANKTEILSASPYVWYVNCTNSLGIAGVSETRNLTIDILAPIVNITTTDPDSFYSNVSGNNQINLIANVTDPGISSGIRYVTANLSVLNQPSINLVNMSYNDTTGLYNATITVSNVSGLTSYFEAKSITAFAYDWAGNNNVSAGPAVVLLYNMTTPPTGGTCQQWGNLTTNLANQTNFSNVNYVLEVQMNLSNCFGMPYNASIMPSWFNNYTTFSLINFTSLNMSSQTIGLKLANMSNNMEIDITPRGQFGDSRIYFNTSYFAELNTSASVTLYHLPFTSEPNVTADVNASGLNTSVSIIWAPGIGEGNLTFVVKGFSGYNTTDLTAPIIAVNSPADGSKTGDATARFNVSVNGTGTQPSYVTITVSNSTGNSTFVYNATNLANVINTANCTNVTPGSELFYCIFSLSSNMSNGIYNISVAAVDFGGASGNSNTSATSFTFSSGPVVTLNSPTTGNVTKNSTVNFNWSIVSTVSATVLCNLTINGTVNQSNINSTNDTSTNYSVTGFVNGTYAWRVLCNDSLDNIGFSATNTFIVDNVPPVVTLLYPANNTVTNEFNVTAGNISLRFNVTDNVASLVNCTLAWGTGVNDSVNFTNVSANGNPFSAGNLAGSDGPTQWYVNCTDTVGNVGTSGNYTFTRDTVAPVINSSSINDTYISSGQAVFVIVNVTDATSAVKNVTANGIGLNNTSGTIWNGTITLTGTAGAANVTIIATDNATNTNTTYVPYTIDNTAPVIIVNSPANGSMIVNADGNLTLNYTVTEVNISSSNVSIDSNTWANSSTSNGSISMNFTGIDAGTHTIVITAYDNASLSSTLTTIFIMSAPINATAKLANMQTSVGTTTLTNVTLKDPANASNDYSTNETLNATALALSMQMSVNATTNATVTIVFNGSSANWNATNFDIETNVSSAIGANTTLNTGANVTALVVFTNMSNFLANTAYTNGTIIVFNQSLNNLTVLYIADDTGATVYKLNNCSGGAPSTITLSTMCYLNYSTNVTIYVPHLSGAALANDTSAPTVNITSPINNTQYNNSYMTFSFDAWEANPNVTSFCWYNLTNSSGQVSYASLGTSSFTSDNTTKYSYSVVLSGLRNNAYNMTVNCTDLKNQNASVTHNFTVNDTTKPVITAINNSVSGSSVTITVTTDEAAACRYYASDANYSNMTNFTTTGALSHSVTINSLSNGAYTYYVRCNDTAGNAMNTSNTTTFTISVSGSCTESWTCTQWSTCLPANTQTRTCTDSNACGTNTSKPSVSQYCVYISSIVQPSCGTGCPTGQTQRAYPDCSCYIPICTTTCGAGQTQRTYPDCSCVTPSNVTVPAGPKETTIVATRGGAIITIPVVAAEKRSPISISAVISDVTGIMEVALTPKRDLAGVKIEISKLDAKPASVDAPPRTAYRYLEIKATNVTENDLSNVTITFKVDKVFIGIKYNASSVTMMRHVSGGWIALDTKMLSQTTTEYIFETTTPGFSYFAITVAELGAPSVSQPTTNETTTQPGAIDWTSVIWVVGIIVVVAVAVLVYNKLKTKKKWKPRSPR